MKNKSNSVVLGLPGMMPDEKDAVKIISEKAGVYGDGTIKVLRHGLPSAGKNRILKEHYDDDVVNRRMFLTRSHVFRSINPGVGYVWRRPDLSYF